MIMSWTSGGKSCLLNYGKEQKEVLGDIFCGYGVWRSLWGVTVSIATIGILYYVYEVSAHDMLYS